MRAMLPAFGLLSLLKLGHQLQEFVLAHKDAFETLSKITVRFREHSLTSRDTHSGIQPDRCHKRQPCTHLQSVEQVSCNLTIRETYGKTAPLRVHVEDRYAAYNPANYGTVVPVYFITNVGLSPIFYCDLLRSSLYGDITKQRIWKDAKRDVVITCYTNVRHGFLLWNTERLVPDVGVPGCIVRVGEKRRWRPQSES